MLDRIICTRTAGYVFTDVNSNCNIALQEAKHTPHDVMSDSLQ